MRATLMYGAGDVRVENVPDPVIKHPTDALVRITASCVCGSDLWPYATIHAPHRPTFQTRRVVGAGISPREGSGGPWTPGTRGRPRCPAGGRSSSDDRTGLRTGGGQ